jgi:c-di-GMP-binding flagellar brake protein YcgR
MDQSPPTRATRLRLQQFLQVHDTDDQQMLGRLVDLSATGMMLIASRELPVGHAFAVEIRAPETLEIPPLRLVAESVWCRNNPNNPSHFGVGFRFSNITADSVSLLEKLLQQPGIVH